MATLNLPLGVGKERALCFRVVCLGGFVGHSLGSVFAWIILRGFSRVLGFFFSSFGFRRSCWGVFGVGLGAFRVFFVFGGYYWGFLLFCEGFYYAC
jgi:hypothetical protein